MLLRGVISCSHTEIFHTRSHDPTWYLTRSISLLHGLVRISHVVFLNQPIPVFQAKQVPKPRTHLMIRPYLFMGVSQYVYTWYDVNNTVTSSYDVNQPFVQIYDCCACISLCVECTGNKIKHYSGHLQDVRVAVRKFWVCLFPHSNKAWRWLCWSVHASMGYSSKTQHTSIILMHLWMGSYSKFSNFP